MLDINTVRGFSKLTPALSILAILAEWAMIIAAIALHLFFPHPAIFIFSWIIIGTRMYALYSLLHDGIHYLIYSDKKINDWLCTLFLAAPLFISLERMRKFHLAHHKFLKTENDPESAHLQYGEFQFPKSRGNLFLIFLKDITGINFIIYKTGNLFRWFRKSMFRNNQYSNDAAQQNQFDPAVFFGYVALVLILIYVGLGKQFLLYWILPYATVYQALNRLRLSTEHFHIPPDKLFQTRTVNLNFFERFFLSPYNLGFHTEHHLYPSVPFYRLPALHEMLMHEAEFRNNTLVKKSYWSVIKDFVASRKN